MFTLNIKPNSLGETEMAIRNRQSGIDNPETQSLLCHKAQNEDKENRKLNKIDQQNGLHQNTADEHMYVQRMAQKYFQCFCQICNFDDFIPIGLFYAKN